MRNTHEQLESRRLLAAYVVDSLLDGPGAADGQLTLREAITAANTNAAFGDAAAGDGEGDSITFASSLFGGTISLTDELAINDDLSIDGQGGYLTLDAGGNSRVFNISGAGTFSVADLILTNGSADAGGAVYVADGSATLDAVVVQNSTATGPAGGGGLYLESGELTINNTKVSGNTAANDAGNASGGGLLAADGTVTIFNSSFDANTAQRAGGAIESTTADVSITNSALTNNSALGAPGNGGAYHVSGSGVTTDVVNSLVTGNFAALEGGGLWNQAGSTMNVTNSLISGNEGAGDAADTGGGGLFNNGGTFNLTDSAVNGNAATGDSGSGGAFLSVDGDVTITNSALNDNVSNRAGGALEVIDGSADISFTLMQGNSTGDAPGNGGAIHVSGMDGTTVDIRNSLFTENVASTEGGALWNQAGSFMNLTSVGVTNNLASGDEADNGGGGIFNNGGDMTIADTLVDGNVADGASGSGGGLLSIAGDITVVDSVLSNNVANRAGGGVEIVDGSISFDNSGLLANVAGPDGSAAPGNGGGLHVSGMDNTQVFVGGGTLVADNVAALEGGGLWNQAGSVLTVDNSVVVRNTALGDAADVGGGGIFNNGGDVIVASSNVDDNLAIGTSGSGGGLFSVDGAVAIVDSTVNGNVSYRAGGGIEIVDGTLAIDATELAGNVTGPDGFASPGNGGAIHVTGMNGTEVLISSSSVTGNFAGGQGGGLWNQTNALLDVLDTVIDGNTTDGPGGGVYNKGEAVLTGSFVVGNTAATGGGIFTTDTGTTTLVATIVEDNDPDDLAGPGVVA